MLTNPSLHDMDATARKNESEVLRGLDSEGLKAIGSAIGKDDSTISKMRSDGRLKEYATIVAAAKKKIVDIDAICISKADFIALKTLAYRGLHEITNEITGSEE